MPINLQTKVFNYTDNEFTTEILTPSRLNRLRDDIKNALDAKFDQVFKPWSKGDMIWYDGSNWNTIRDGNQGQILAYENNEPVWKSLIVNLDNSFGTLGVITKGDMLWHNGTDWVILNKGNVDQILTLNSESEPIWKDRVGSDFVFTGTAQRGDILYYGSGNTWQLLNKGTNGQILEQGANDPSWIDKPESGYRFNYYSNNSTTNFALSTVAHNAVKRGNYNDDYTDIQGIPANPFNGRSKYWYMFDLNMLTLQDRSTFYVTGETVVSTIVNSGAPVGNFELVSFLTLNNSNINYNSIKNDYYNVIKFVSRNSGHTSGIIKVKYKFENNVSSGPLVTTTYYARFYIAILPFIGSEVEANFNPFMEVSGYSYEAYEYY